MGLGKTFTNSIVREIGRNYGKAISNSLLGDKHSTPHRLVGSTAIDRKRGRVYQNDLDKAIKKFEIKGFQATFNQALNIHSEYFELVDEANADGAIDLNELLFLIKSSKLAIPTLERAKGALIDYDKQDLADKVEAKITDISDFIKTLNSSLDVNKLPEVKFNPVAALFGLLSFFGLDRVYFSPKKFKSYYIAFFGLSPYFIAAYANEMKINMEELPSYLLLIGGVGVTMPLWYFLWYNRKIDGGYWGYRRNKKKKEAHNSLAIQLKELLEDYTSSL